MKMIVQATSKGAVVNVEGAVGSACQTAVEGLTKALGAKITETELKPEYFETQTDEQKVSAGN